MTVARLLPLCAVVWLAAGCSFPGGETHRDLAGIVRVAPQPDDSVMVCKRFIHWRYRPFDTSRETIGEELTPAHIDALGRSEKAIDHRCAGEPLPTAPIPLADGGELRLIGPFARDESSVLGLQVVDPSGAVRWTIHRTVKSLSRIVGDHLFVGGWDSVFRVRLVDGTVEWTLPLSGAESLD
jgi:hypothetical protein